MASSIFSRKRDLVYLVFFIIHIPVMLAVDLTPLYPAWAKPQFMTDIRTFYTTTYHDRFFTDPPAWFQTYIHLEALYHLPLSLWAIRALVRNDPKVPLQLLVWAVQTGVTTLTCVADYTAWEGYGYAEKVELGKLYLPYLGLAVFMGVDMFLRLSRRLEQGVIAAGAKKSN